MDPGSRAKSNELCDIEVLLEGQDRIVECLKMLCGEQRDTKKALLNMQDFFQIPDRHTSFVPSEGIGEARLEDWVVKMNSRGVCSNSCFPVRLGQNGRRTWKCGTVHLLLQTAV